MTPAPRHQKLSCIPLLCLEFVSDFQSVHCCDRYQQLLHLPISSLAEQCDRQLHCLARGMRYLKMACACASQACSYRVTLHLSGTLFSKSVFEHWLRYHTPLSLYLTGSFLCQEVCTRARPYHPGDGHLPVSWALHVRPWVHIQNT